LRPWWDLAFLAWGAAMAAAGWLLHRQGRSRRGVDTSFPVNRPKVEA
jgi:hypothetical protein